MMNQKTTYIRKLSAIEEAFTLSNEAIPLSVACVLHLAQGPDVRDLAAALDRLQNRHLLLRAGVWAKNGRYYFQNMDTVRPIACRIVERVDEESWRAAAEEAINLYFDKAGPLMRCWYLPNPEKGAAELIVCFHHSIIDGISARLLLHELLSLAGGLSLPPPAPEAPHAFPPDYQKWNLAKRLLAFAPRQMKEEWQYKQTGTPSPIPGHSKNAVLSFRLSPDMSRKLSFNAGKMGLSINSVLLAAITQAVLRRKHAGENFRQARVISFADLRESVIPPASNQELGCYISMLRMGVPVSEDQTVSQLAAHIQKALFKAGRRGEVFLMSLLSPYLMRMALRLKNQRLSVSALSFIGKLDLEPHYGPISLHNVMAFITNNRFGPEFSAFGKVLFGSIGLDFTYLTAETEATLARQMMEDIRENLEDMANLPNFETFRS
jgi:NRPS condensation-like uncharacterized protein